MNDQINLLIIRVLGGGFILGIVGIIVCYCWRGTVPNEMWLFANGISTGFIGYLSRDFSKYLQPQTIGPNESVTVSSPEKETEDA